MVKFDTVMKSFQEDFWKKPKVVLDSLSFQVEKGSICGFLGANGAGKTTSLKAMLGFIPIDSGEISFDSEMGSKRDEILSNLGYFPEAPYFYTHMTGMEFCLYLGKLQSVPMSQLTSRIKEWGDRLNISYALEKRIRGYSKGMLQRLGFLTSLLHDPKFVLLDEPLSGLDPLGRKEFKDILVELNNRGVTIFFSSHIVADVEEICDSLVVIREGKLFYSGKTKDLLDQRTAKDLRVSFSSHVKPDKSLKTFKPIKVSGNDYLGTLSEDEKSVFIEYISSSKGNLYEFQLERLSLEEIIYLSNQEDE